MTDESEVSAPPAEVPAEVMDAGLDLFVNLAAPQAGYLQAIENGGWPPADGRADRDVQSCAQRTRVASPRALLVGRAVSISATPAR